MKVSGGWLRRQIAICLAMLLLAPFGVAATTPGQQDQSQNPQSSQTAPPAQQPVQRQNGNSPAANQTNAPASPATACSASLPAAPQSNGDNGSSQSTRQQTKAPLGTAAAPVENPVGVAVSRPAGAAIAPAKQRRTRIFLIRMGLVIGAAVAVGTVVGLSKASPSRPQ